MTAAILPGVSAIPVAAAAETDYYVMSPTANSYNKDGGSISLTWRNPAAALAKVSLYQMNADGTETLLDGSLSTESGARQVKEIPDLDAAVIYRYKVVSEFTDNHAPTSVILSSDAASFAEDPFKSNNSAVGLDSGKQFGRRVLGAVDKAPEYYIDPEVKYEGKASLHIKNNYDEANGIFTYNTGKLTVGSENYVLSGYIKANKYKANWILGYFNNSETAPAAGFLANSDNEVTCDWQPFNIAISGSQGSWDDIFVKILLGQYPAEDLWIDNLRLVEIGTGTDVFAYGDTWIGGFENFVAPEAPSATVVQNGNKASLSISVPDSAKKIYVYETIDNTDVVRAVLDKSVATVELEGVSGTLKVSAKSNATNARNVMSEKVEARVLEDADYYGYAPTFYPASVDGKTAEISWRNPQIGCTKVSLYDVTNPLKPVAVKEDCPTAAGEPVTVTAENLTPGNQYVYKVIYEFAEHAATSMIIGGYAGSFEAADYVISGSNWGVRIDGATKNTTTINIDTNEKVSGAASLHITDNSLAYGNTFLRCRIDAANIEVGETYVLSMKVKANQYIPHDSLIGMIYQQGWWQFINEKPTGPFDYDWVTLSKEITASNDDKDWPFVAIMLPRMAAKDMWIDDITFCKKGTIENIISGGGFEEYVPASEVTNAAVQSVGDGIATIGYTIPRGTQAVYIYQKVGDKLVERARVSEMDSVTIDGLQNGAKNELVIKTLSTGYVLSNGVSITADLPFSRYSTGNYKLYSGNTQISAPAAGEMTVKLEVTNLQMGADFKPCYIVAAYDGDCLVDCTVVDNIVIGENETKTLSASVTVGADVKKCKIKAFLWKDYEKMGILKANGEF